MKIVKRSFANTVKNYVKRAKQEVAQRYRLSPGNNVYLICEKLIALQSSPGTYVECGVFQGNTLFTVATILKYLSNKRVLYGFDTFSGFPQEQIDERDHPGSFLNLFEQGLISEDNFKKAAQRTNNFTDESHLTKEYFFESRSVFDIANHFENVRLVKGAFKDTLTTATEPIVVLFLDCDLYQSYKDCLEILYPYVISGGAIIFDEYYSWKYPGARLAVNEFLGNKNGLFELYFTEERFERWCFIKS